MDTIQTARTLLARASEVLKSKRPDAGRVGAEAAWMAATGVGDYAARVVGVRKEVKMHGERAYYLGKLAERAGMNPGEMIQTFNKLKDFHVDCAYQNWCDASEIRAGIATARGLVHSVERAAAKVDAAYYVGPFRPRRGKRWSK